jgi:stage VI sporulation protein D
VEAHHEVEAVSEAEAAVKLRESHAVDSQHEVEVVSEAIALDQAEAVEAVEAAAGHDAGSAEHDAAHGVIEAVEAIADDGNEDDRPVLETDSATLETVYEFEDELPESQVIVSAAPEVVEQPAASGPKLSVGSKSSFDSGTGVKLSSLLGESRPRDLESPTTLGSIVSNNGGNAPAAPAAHAQSIVGNNGGSIAESDREDSIVSNNGGSIENVPPLYTPAESAHDSVWGNFLRQKETKTTLKFRIVHEQDSLGELAEQYNTTPSELQRVNRLQRQEVEAGQILYIPTKRR